MRTLRQGSRSLLLLAASFVLPFSLLTLYWAKYIQRDYFPYGDEFALLVHSARIFHPSIASWFLEGYSRYFVAYPEWASSSTNFVRPFANAVFYLNSLAFGSRWSCYLLLSYAIQSGIVAVSVQIARQKLDLPLRFGVLVGVLAFISPAFGGKELFFPSFAFDLLGALLVLLGLNELLSGRYTSAWFFFAVAVFTKETTLFSPIAAALIVLFDRRRSFSISPRLVRAAIFLVPILAWSLLRYYAFSGSWGGIYVFGAFTLKSQSLKILHGILSWPFGMRTSAQGVLYRDVFFFLNGSFWIAVFIALVRTYTMQSRRESVDSAVVGEIGEQFGLRSKPSLIILVFCVGSLEMPLLLDLQQRFGAVFYPLMYLVLACVAHYARGQDLRRMAAVILISAAIVSIYQKAVDPDELPAMRANWELSADYIKRLHDSRANTVFLVDDASGGFAAPGAIAQFANYSGNLVRVNSIEVLFMAACHEQPRVGKERTGSRNILLSADILPSCGYYAFDGVPPETISSADRGILYRNTRFGFLHYKVPDYHALPRSGVPALFGELLVEIENIPPRSSVIIPRLESLHYEESSLDGESWPAVAFVNDRANNR